MGLHVDIDQVYCDNMNRNGVRKSEGVLINQGDKLKPEEKAVLLDINQAKYGLSTEYLKYLKLPRASRVKIYDIEKIVNSN